MSATHLWRRLRGSPALTDCPCRRTCQQQSGWAPGPTYSLCPAFPPLRDPDQALDTGLHLLSCYSRDQGWGGSSPRGQVQWHGHCLPRPRSCSF